MNRPFVPGQRKLFFLAAISYAQQIGREKVEKKYGREGIPGRAPKNDLAKLLQLPAFSQEAAQTLAEK